jgi:hypothetical protein
MSTLNKEEEQATALPFPQPEPRRVRIEPPAVQEWRQTLIEAFEAGEVVMK